MSPCFCKYISNKSFQGQSIVEGEKREIKFTKCISTWLDDKGTVLPDKVEAESEGIFSELLKPKKQ